MAVTENDLIVGPLVLAAGVDTISLDFYFEKKDWLSVYKAGSETPLVLDTDYTVSGEGTVTGVVTLAVPANGNDAYSVYLHIPLERISDMQLRGEFRSDPFNKELDRIWQAMQGNATSAARALRVGSASPQLPPIVYSAGEMDGRTFIMKDDGSAIVPGPNAADVSDAQANAAAAAASAAQAALYDGPRFDTVQELLANTTLVYSGAGTVVTPGDHIRVDGGFVYVVADAAATDQHETTAGGVKLYETGNSYTTLMRLQDAIARGVNWRDGDIVSAAGIFYLVDSASTTIAGLTGFSPYIADNANNALLLDGQPASYFTNATNLTSGEVPAGRLDIGTGANQLVALDAGAKLPAVDGSQLTNLPSASPLGWDTIGSIMLLVRVGTGAVTHGTIYPASELFLPQMTAAGDASTVYSGRDTTNLPTGSWQAIGDVADSNRQFSQYVKVS